MYFENDMFGNDGKLLYNYIYVQDGHDHSRMNLYEKTMDELIFDPVLNDLKNNKEVVNVCSQIKQNSDAFFNIQGIEEFCDSYSSYTGYYNEDGSEETTTKYKYNQNKFDERYYRYKNLETLNKSLLTQIGAYQEQLQACKTQINNYEIEKRNYLDKSNNAIKKFAAKKKYNLLISQNENEKSNLENIIAELNSQINSNNENFKLMANVLKKQEIFENTWYNNGEFVDINKPLKEKVDTVANRYIKRRLPELIKKYPELLNYSYKDNPILLADINGYKFVLNLGQNIQLYIDLLQQKGQEETDKIFGKDRDEKFMQQLAKEEKQRKAKQKKIDEEQHESSEIEVIYE